MRKIKIAFLGIIMMFILTACIGNGDSKATKRSAADGRISISIWHNFAGDDLRARKVRNMIANFEEENPTIEVDEQAIPVDGYRQRISTVAAANELPDIFLTYAGSFTDEFYNGELIQPITSLFEENPEWKNSFLEGALEPYKYDGELYSAPIAMSATSFLYYNKDLFTANNLEVPETWAEFVQVIKVFNDKGITPIAMGNKAPWVAQSTTFGAIADRVTGTNWFLDAVEQEDASFTDPIFIDALHRFKELVDNGAYSDGANSMDNTQAEQYFAQGKAAMMINGAWTLSSLGASQSEQVLTNIGVSVVPGIEGGKGSGNTITGGPGGGFLLSSETKGEDKQAALKLIYKLSNADAQKEIAESNSMVMYDVDIDKENVNPLFFEAFNLIREVEFAPVYDLYLTSEAGEAVNNGLQEIMLGGDPEKVAESIQKAQSSN
ncbi:extracellular solute-binding protein [Agaribacter marinus]|uniref:Extracellular solute-binding protein n=1 Tax=Virgibacillus salarius TaxID=447199 RepID=A0A941DVR8_9BACI|nr:extracellular solute-binding protein [Virgibacillus salarius]MBR7797675.1 extracellular solute-binding protein [Virgibacillus salarius]NAZ10385.1 extracellular solute-binding protein [Agaribacter marinus]